MSDILQVGDSNPRVAEVRTLLARLGKLPGVTGGTTPAGQSAQLYQSDSIYDEALKEAVRAFQQERGIRADGLITPGTLQLMREASYVLGTRVLKFEPSAPMSGDDVHSLQDQLAELGFYTAPVNGHFNAETYEAVRQYQNAVGLEPDGICGPSTFRELSLLGRRITGGSPAGLREKEKVRQAGPKLSGKRIVIDAHRSTAEPGVTVQGPFGPITEEEILWDLASRIEGRMVAVGVETIQSRPRHDNPSPEERAELANAVGADLVISLSADTYSNERGNGVATFYFGSTVGKNSLVGEMLSGFIQREIVARTPLGDCRTHARTWDLLRLTQMPTVEVSVGYLSNPHDIEVLTDPAHREAIAEAVIVAIKRLYLLEDDFVQTGTFDFRELIEVEKNAD
ncbi:N-acetylmuramoyl-L-alanine amidase [Corynebacterium ulceribovis]|uniref:N-acetylmuramoyl-L-alanine amidase n=1 Tax=Corynebacterium ulceribovis TaxID=487732 RepID=UPI00035D7BDB|nr:N-acetylmuramoyl-L-alanine amidase [Corynebacterium ulceribovis]